VELSDASSYADILVGNKDKIKVIELVEKHLAEDHGASQSPGEPFAVHSIDSVTMFEEMGNVISQEETRAYIKIEDGCNSFCSYCAIPLARGRIRSRDESAVIAEAEGLVMKGFREIVLSGIHVCSYGADRLQESDALIDLCGRLSFIEGLERIRLGSLEPQSLTERFIRKAAGIDVLCPHFHLSLQSGSDSVLRRMNRHYSTDDYERIVESIRKRIPMATITTDVITGFPGETGEEHRQTMEFCRKIHFLDIHVFRFSERKGTKAASMTPKVDAKTAAARSGELLALALESRQEQMKQAVGSMYRVLVEKTSDHSASGYTENYIPATVLFPGGRVSSHAFAAGSILTVKAIGYDRESIITEIPGAGNVDFKPADIETAKGMLY
jgi:threonylcarbamoyladenosine tRNA methylthiotransferase MtaB